MRKLCHVINNLLSKGAGLRSTEEAILLPTQQPRFESWLCPDFFSLHLSLWTALRSNPSSARQWISQMQLVVTSRAKYYKKDIIALGYGESTI